MTGEGMLVATQEIEALIDGNTREPGDKLRIALERGKSIPGLQEGILKHIVRILVGENDMTYLPIQRFAEPAYQCLETLTLGSGVGK